MNDDRPTATATLLDPLASAPRAIRPERPRIMTLEQMATVAPIMPTEPVPDRFRQRARNESSLYVVSEGEPEVTLTKERIPGDKPVWRIAVHSSKRALPGLAVQSVERVAPSSVAGRARAISNFGHRPPWVGVDFFP